MDNENKLSDDTQNKDKKQKRKLIIRIFCAAATLILLIISLITFGWFTHNKSVDGDLGGFSSANGSFELAAVGANGKYDSYIDAADGEQLSGILTDTSDVINPVATTGGNEIKWMMSADSNMENNAESTSNGIQPGSSGKLTFYVIAKRDGQLNINFSLDTVLYNNKVKPVDESNDNSSCIITDEKCAKLVSGHILFFENYDDTNKVYSDRINNTFNFKRADAKTNTAYKVDIYWIWPNVIDQLILPKGDSLLQNNQCERIIAANDETIYTDIIQNQGNYFDTTISEIQNMLENMKSGSAADSFNQTYYTTLSSEWNNADQTIGTTVSYIELKLTAN